MTSSAQLVCQAGRCRSDAWREKTYGVLLCAV